VSVFLPRAVTRAERSPVRCAEPSEQRTSHAVVLAVDDDAAVRSTTADILKDLGYSVLQADSGEAALELLEEEGMIDVLLTDVVMTGMSGPELVRRARQSQPRLPVVFISGYADPAGTTPEGLLQPLVRKPFRPAELRRQIEAALAGSPATAW
jgi:CheY-like chemotaxis protein